MGPQLYYRLITDYVRFPPNWMPNGAQNVAISHPFLSTAERTLPSGAHGPGFDSQGGSFRLNHASAGGELDSKTTRPTKVKTKSGQGEMKPPGQQNSGQNPAALGHTPEIALAFGGRRFLLKHKFRPKSCGAGQSVKMQS